MKRLFLSLSAACVLLNATPALAFMNEVALLKEELQAYQSNSAHAADFSDIVERLSNEENGFNDVHESDWFSAAVMALKHWGILGGKKNVNGEPTGEFDPEGDVTFGAALKISFKAAQKDLTTCEGGSVDSHSHWASVYLVCAKDMHFRILEARKAPNLDNTVTRAQVLAIIHDAFGEKVTYRSAPFKDTVKHPYEADIALAYEQGVVTGDKVAPGKKHQFRPNALLSRAELAIILFNELNVRAKEELQAKAGKDGSS